MSSLMPLAARMRPQSIDDIVGQQHLVGPGAPLRQMIETRTPVSMLLWGPPGTGKTTLAGIVAAGTGAAFEQLSAVNAGLPELREVIARANQRRAAGQRTVLFLDEIHRFDKRQQDALLPHVENGLLVLVGATTESPFKMLNQALLSRLRIFRLSPLENADLAHMVEQALGDERGLAGAVSLDADALRTLVGFGAGDARRTLTLLEAVSSLRLAQAPAPRPLPIDYRDIVRVAQGPAHDYDQSGVLSAFIKAIRGSDPDGALYWLAVMLEAEEDPRVIGRRLLISAGEDIGLADPQALSIAAAALVAAEQVGMPEAHYDLATATVALALAPKSNRAGAALHAAREEVRTNGPKAVPVHLRASAKAYRNPHDEAGAQNDQSYLPAGIATRRFYEPAERGWEGEQAGRLADVRALRAKAKKSS